MTDVLRFCPPLAELYAADQVTGKSGETFSSLASLSSANNLITLRNLFLEAEPERTLEIGLAFGGSALVFTHEHRRAGHEPTGQHTAIDPFQDSVWDDVGIKMCEEAGLREYLTVHRALSSKTLPEIWSSEATFGMIYIDGSHIFEDVFIDFYYSLRILEEGGLLLFDDCADAHVQKVLRFIRTNMADQLTEIDISPFRPAAANNVTYRIAKAMNRVQLVGFRRTGPTERSWDATFHSF